MEPSEKEVLAEPDGRWNVSGKAEVNCLACHNRSGRQDHSEWAKQVLRENLRWAATAAGGVGEVGGMASRLKETWDVYDGPNLDDHEWAVAPSVKYRTVDFDSKQRYFFDLNYKPSDDRCLVCHSVSPKDAAMWTTEADVHTAAGLKCTDCHRGDLSHLMVRGYEGEAADTGNRAAASFTCRGCHLGENEDGERTVLPGRLGAPYPKHTGIPLVHFKRLACTVCHSGPKPKEGFTRVRTSRANRLGVYGVATWSTDTPMIIEPVYMKDGRDKISPQRLVWPAFWGRRSGKRHPPAEAGRGRDGGGRSSQAGGAPRAGPHRPEPGHGRGRDACSRVRTFRLCAECRRRPRRDGEGRDKAGRAGLLGHPEGRGDRAPRARFRPGGGGQGPGDRDAVPGIPSVPGH